MSLHGFRPLKEAPHPPPSYTSLRSDFDNNHHDEHINGNDHTAEKFSKQIENSTFLRQGYRSNSSPAHCSSCYSCPYWASQNAKISSLTFLLTALALALVTFGMVVWETFEIDWNTLAVFCAVMGLAGGGLLVGVLVLYGLVRWEDHRPPGESSDEEEGLEGGGKDLLGGEDMQGKGRVEGGEGRRQRGTRRVKDVEGGERR